VEGTPEEKMKGANVELRNKVKVPPELVEERIIVTP
jgi:hypothetical protein